MKNRSLNSLYYAPILLLLFFGNGYFTAHVRAATYTVTSGADSGRGTLRETVLISSSGDTIVFDPAVNLIVLTSGEIVIKKMLVIQGPGANLLSITANASSRIFRISKGVKLTIADIELQKGVTTDFGGAIFNEGSLLLRRAFVKRSSARQGGAIYSTGSIKVEDSTIYFNEALNGGGISVGPTADLAEFTNTTISGNTATSDDGGGLTSRSRLLFVNHCTIVQNTSMASYATGGLEALTANAFVSNSIIADNHGTPFNDVLGVINSQGTNLVGDPNGNSGQWDVTDLLGVNPSLGSLQYNNGGTTPTYAPLPGSPAIDAGDESNTTALDQNGATRVRGATVDIGAVEFQPIVQTITVQNGNDSGPGSFREAVANCQPGGVIRFSPSVATIALDSQININKNLVINGPGAGWLTITISSNYTVHALRPLNISSGYRVRISDLTLLDVKVENHGTLFLTNTTLYLSWWFEGYANYDHALLFSYGSLILNKCLLFDSRIWGGIDIASGTLIINNSTLRGNEKVYSGAGGNVFLDGLGKIKNSTITAGGALYSGGIYVGGGNLVLINSTISKNSGYRSGGIYVQAGAVASLINCTVTENLVYDGETGGIHSHDNVYLRNTIVAGNSYYWFTPNVDIEGGIISTGHNLIGHVGTSSGYDSTDLLNVNPLLLPLGNYGGLTQTVALQSGSPAIDAGDNYLAPPTDQRGVSRLLNTADIGAYEYP